MTDDSEELRAALLMITHKANEANIHRDEDDVLETIIEIARAALAAAPQPAPERTLLAKIVQDAMIRTGVRWDSRSSDAIADALLARGLRLPGDDALQQLADLGQQADRASETMAWAVLGSDGRPMPDAIYSERKGAHRLKPHPQARIVRVAIRIVEDSDDAA